MPVQQSMSWGAMIFLFLGAIALVTVMALVIKLLGRKGILWFLGIVGGLAIVGLVLAWFTFTAYPQVGHTSITASRVDTDGHGNSRSVTVVDEAKSTESGQPITSPDMEWKPSADFEFEADIYPSAVSAGLFAAKRLWSRMADKEEIPSRPSLNMYVDNNGGKYATELALALERELPISEVEIFGPEYTPPGAPERPIIVLSIPGLATDPTSEANSMEMNLNCRRTGIGHRVRFIQKPWAEESGENLSHYGQNPFVWVVHSQGLFATREQAERQALNHAVDRIEDEIRQQFWVKRQDIVDRERFRVAIESLLKNGAYELGTVRNRGSSPITDRFTQCFSRPYGKVYRQAILMDIPYQQFERLQQANVSCQNDQRKKLLTHIASIAGMILLITVVYLFLNAATRGYYVWSLRVAGVVIVVAGVLLVLNYA